MSAPDSPRSVVSPAHVAVAAAGPAHPKIVFGDTPDLRGLVAEKLGRNDDALTFCDSYWTVMRTVTLLKDWKQLSTPRKVWAVFWRVVTGVFLLIGLIVPIIAAGPNQYLHNRNVTLGGVKNGLAEKASKVYWTSAPLPQNANQWSNNIVAYKDELTRFEDRLWNRLKHKTLAPLLESRPHSSPAEKEERFAYDLAHINMETFITDVLMELDKSLEGNTKILPETKMRMAYDICEDLWGRYKKQMEHYPWLKNPDDASQPITPLQARDATAKMVYQRMAMNTALMKYWICHYSNKDAVDKPAYSHGYRPKGKISDHVSKNSYAQLNDWLGFDRPSGDGKPVMSLNERLQRFDPDFVRAEVATFVEELDYEPFMPARPPRDAAMNAINGDVSKLEGNVLVVQRDQEPAEGFSPEVAALIEHYGTPAHVNAAIAGYGDIGLAPPHLIALRDLQRPQQYFVAAPDLKAAARAIIDPLKLAMAQNTDRVTRDSIIAAREDLHPDAENDNLDAIIVTEAEIAAEKRKFTTIQHNLGNHPENSPITAEMLAIAGIPAEQHANIIAMHQQYFHADDFIRNGQAKIEKLKKVAALYGIIAQKRNELAEREEAQGQGYEQSRAAYQAVVDNYRGALKDHLSSDEFISPVQFVPIDEGDPVVSPLAARVSPSPKKPRVRELRIDTSDIGGDSIDFKHGTPSPTSKDSGPPPSRTPPVPPARTITTPMADSHVVHSAHTPAKSGSTVLVSADDTTLFDVDF